MDGPKLVAGGGEEVLVVAYHQNPTLNTMPTFHLQAENNTDDAKVE